MYLRPYQNEAIQSIYHYYQGNQGNPILALPTGTGKSVVQAGFLHNVLSTAPNQRILCLTHVKELVEQNSIRCRQVWPTAPIGIHSAGLGRRDYHNPIVFGGIQSCAANPYKFGARDLIIVDECHLIGPNESTQYGEFLNAMEQLNPHVKVIGMTATPYRMGQGMLTDPPVREGERRLFTDICYNITNTESFNKLIDDIYLGRLIPRPTETQIDLSNVQTAAGDYVLSQLASEIEKQEITANALLEARELGKDRRSWLVFASGVKNTETIATMLNNMGIPATCVHSKIPNTKSNPQRDNRIKQFKQYGYRALVVNNIGTTGFDHPGLDLIVDLRPTTSIVLHVQKYGRGTRLLFHPGYSFEQLKEKHYREKALADSWKHDCMVLDFAGNVSRLGPINDPRVPKPRGEGTGDIPLKVCPWCGAYNYCPARFCCNELCNYEFIFKTKVKRKSSTLDLIKANEPQISMHKVKTVTAKIHKAKSGKTMLRITYVCGLNVYRAFIGFKDETKGLTLKNGIRWWRQHHGDDVPTTAADALAKWNECRSCTWLKVDTGKEYPEILEYLFI